MSKNRKSISKELRFKVYNKYNGHCAYCGCELEYKDMQVDHIDSYYINTYYGNNDNIDISNLNPACRMCNFYKSTMPIEKFREQLGLIVDRLNKDFTYRLAKKYNLIEEKEIKIKFYYEVLNEQDN